MCSNLYAHFVYELGEYSYHPLGTERIASNRLFGMFHSGTVDHNKEVIMKSMFKPDRTVRAVCATIALRMGVDFVGLNTVLHYGAPRSLEDYFQECGRAKRSGEQSYSTIYWSPADAPTQAMTHKEEIVRVRNYLENSEKCRRSSQLLEYYIRDFKTESEQKLLLCCDVCIND